MLARQKQLTLVLALAVVLAAPALAANGEAKKDNSAPGSELFVPGPLRQIKIEVKGKDLQQLQANNRAYVRATFWEGSNVLHDVGIHLKGAAGSFRGLGPDDQPAVTVHFNKYVTNQTWHGLKKVHLNNSVQDGSYLCENICGELFRQAGVPAARVGNVRFTLNDRDRGFYVLIEGLDKTFIKQYFRHAEGNLYDGGFCRDIDQPLQKIFGNAAKDQLELRALEAAANETNRLQRFQKLQQLLDFDRFVSFCAMEVMTWDWDGYVLKPNNYKLYWDPETKKITFLPHGMDQMFWEPQGSVRQGGSGMVVRGLLQTPQGRRLYRERMMALTTNVFRVEAITNRINAYAAHIRAAIAEKDPNAARDYDGRVQDIRDKVIARAAFLNKELILSPGLRLSFTNDVAYPHDWFVQDEPATAVMSRGHDPDGKSTLSIRTAMQTAASWRARLMLDGGRYRFEGLARTANVIPVRSELGEGAGLRISGTQETRPNKLSGTASWQKLEFEFEVLPPSDEVVLVCELRASGGQVWFDADSLKLVKLK